MVSFNVKNNEENGLLFGNSNKAGSETVKNGKKQEKQQLKNGALYAGASGLQQDPIALKRIKVAKDAMKGVIERFANDKETDDDLAARSQHIQDLKEEIKDTTSQLNDLYERKDAISREDPERYKEEVKLYNEAIKELSVTNEKAAKMIKAESDSITSTKNAIAGARVSMIDSAKVKDAIFKSGNKEITGMLLDEAKEHVDEEVEKNKEKAEKLAEDKAEKEAAEQKRAEKEQLEQEVIESAKDTPDTVTQDTAIPDTVGQSQNIKEDLKLQELRKEMQSIIQKNKLLEDDLKGIELDKQV